ncbi:hypothetical protein MRX96_004693 [Rhipicephalus microplus]
MPDVPSECIVCLGDAMYSVPSSSGFGSYQVDASIGLCSCWRGNQGAFCKHQAVVQKAFGGPFLNSLVLTLGRLPVTWSVGGSGPKAWQADKSSANEFGKTQARLTKGLTTNVYRTPKESDRAAKSETLP